MSRNRMAVNGKKYKKNKPFYEEKGLFFLSENMYDNSEDNAVSFSLE